MFHEERELVGSVVMEDDLKESKVCDSEMCVVEMGRKWSVRKRSNDRRRRILFWCVGNGGVKERVSDEEGSRVALFNSHEYCIANMMNDLYCPCGIVVVPMSISCFIIHSPFLNYIEYDLVGTTNYHLIKWIFEIINYGFLIFYYTKSI